MAFSDAPRHDSPHHRKLDTKQHASSTSRLRSPTPAPAKMLDITHFEEVFAPDTHRGDIYPHSTVNAIRANRRTLGGALFFDKLLSQLQVKSN